MDWDPYPSHNSLSAHLCFIIRLDINLNYDWLEFKKVRLDIIMALQPPLVVLTLFLLVGHRRLAGSNKPSHYDHRLILCAVGILARGAGLALRPHRDRKCRSTEIIMCAVGHLLVHESSKCRSTEIIMRAVGHLLVHERI
jgi:hypothetical protein